MAAISGHIGQILMHSPDQTIPPINFKLRIYTNQVISQVLTFNFFNFFFEILNNIWFWLMFKNMQITDISRLINIRNANFRKQGYSIKKPKSDNTCRNILRITLPSFLSIQILKLEIMIITVWIVTQKQKWQKQQNSI